MTPELMKAQEEIEDLLEAYYRHRLFKSEVASRLLFMVESRAITRAMEMVGHMWKSVPMFVPKPEDSAQLSLWDEKK